MTKEVKISNTLSITGYLFFGCLFLLAYVFYQQRMMTFDSSFFSFGMIDAKSYNVVVGRWGQLLPQLLPLLVFKLGGSLAFFLKTYSVSCILCYFLIYLLIVKVMKHEKAGWILLLSMCLCYRDVFYYATAELHLGLVTCVLLYALLDRFSTEKYLGSKWIHLFFIILTILFISQCNPITLFPVVFIFGYIFIRDKKHANFYFYFSLLFSIVWYYVYLKVLNKSDYDEGKLVSLSVFLEQLKYLKDLPSTRYFVSFFLQHYLSFSALAITLFLLLLNSKNRWLAVFCCVFPVMYLLVILITYYKGESPIMYQNYYTFFGVFVSLPFLDHFSKSWSTKFKHVVIIILLVINVRGIYLSNEVFSMRLDYMERLEKNAQQLPGTKFLVSGTTFPWEYTWVKWAFPFETLLHSSVKDGKPSKTFYLLDDIDQADSLLNKPNVFLGPDWSPLWFSSDHLNTDYFAVGNDQYRKLTTQQYDSINVNYTNKKQAAVFFEHAIYTSNQYDFTVVPLSVVNFTSQKIAAIPSKSSPLLIAYQLKDEDGNVIEPSYRRAEFESDILRKTTTGLTVDNPSKKGYYTLEAFLIVENKTSASNVAVSKFVVD